MSDTISDERLELIRNGINTRLKAGASGAPDLDKALVIAINQALELRALRSSAGAVKANGDAQDIADRLKRIEDDRYRRMALDAAMMIEYLNSLTPAYTANAEQVTVTDEMADAALAKSRDKSLSTLTNTEAMRQIILAALSGAK